MKKWEYKIIYMKYSEVDRALRLCKEGMDGWEIVSANEMELGTKVYFKREKLETQKPDDGD